MASFRSIARAKRALYLKLDTAINVREEYFSSISYSPLFDWITAVPNVQAEETSKAFAFLAPYGGSLSGKQILGVVHSHSYGYPSTSVLFVRHICGHMPNVALTTSTGAEAAAAFGEAAGMAVYEMKLAQTGEGIAECELLRWFVKQGDEVQQFQPVCEVQSDKATVEITSRYHGIVSQMHFVPGDIIKVGETLLDLLPMKAAAAALPSVSPAPVPAELRKEAAANLEVSECQKKEHAHVLSSPAVRALARSYGISLADVEGMGEKGRVLKDDVLRYATAKQLIEEESRMEESALEGPPASSTAVAAVDADDAKASVLDASAGGGGAKTHPVVIAKGQSSLKTTNVGGRDVVVPIRGYRRAMAKSMAAATSVPHFSFMDEVEVDELVTLRVFLKEAVRREGLQTLTLMPLIAKALSCALLKFPTLNASVDSELSAIHCKGSHNIGIAMATKDGLVVPNIKNCQSLSIVQIAHELERLRRLAEENRVGSEDLSGGTISVSNIGSVGGTYASPILNLPQVAIMALGRIRTLPRYDKEGHIRPSSILNVSWTADHRVVDGATLAQCHNELRKFLSNPSVLLLNLK